MSVKEFVTAYGDSAFQRREEVVRCLDCVHSLLHGTECRHFAAYEPIAGGDEYEEVTYSVKPDGFCAWATRKEDE